MDREVTVTALEPFTTGTGRHVRRGQSVQVKASEALALERQRKISLTRTIHTTAVPPEATPAPDVDVVTPTRRRRAYRRRDMVPDE